MDEARRTLDLFIAHLEHPNPQQTFFSIKVRFDLAEGKAEHIWLADVRYTGTQFSGTINNVPKSIKDITLGSRVTVSRDPVTDWMIVEGGRLVGGTTIRVARNRKSGADREAFDRSVPFRWD